MTRKCLRFLYHRSLVLFRVSSSICWHSAPEKWQVTFCTGKKRRTCDSWQIRFILELFPQKFMYRLNLEPSYLVDYYYWIGNSGIGFILNHIFIASDYPIETWIIFFNEFCWNVHAKVFSGIYYHIIYPTELEFFIETQTSFVHKDLLYSTPTFWGNSKRRG